MAQDYTKKQLDIATDATSQSTALLAALDSLENDAGLLAQTGGNFADPIFEGTNLGYLTAYHVNVMLQQAVPGILTFLRTKVAGDDGLPTYRELLEMLVKGPY